MSQSFKPYNELDARTESITRRKSTSKIAEVTKSAAEPHVRVTANFLSRCATLKLSKEALLLYLHMLLRSAPVETKRSKCAEVFGDVIRKGEFFESKLRVASALGKGHIKDKSKINWFSRTVKPLVDLGLVQQIHAGRRGYNATYIVFDIREVRASMD
jgi:hypothetical protein